MFSRTLNATLPLKKLKFSFIEYKVAFFESDSVVEPNFLFDMKLNQVFALFVVLNKVNCCLQGAKKVRALNEALFDIIQSLARCNHEITIFKNNASSEIFESVAEVPHIV